MIGDATLRRRGIRAVGLRALALGLLVSTGGCGHPAQAPAPPPIPAASPLSRQTEEQAIQNNPTMSPAEKASILHTNTAASGAQPTPGTQ